MERIINVGIASFGMSGRIFHAPLLKHHPGFRIARIVERSTNEAALLYPDAIISRSLEEVVHDPTVDLVIVNTPDATHADYTTACLKAGKHVVVEKPFTQTVAQGTDLIRCAQQNGTLLTVFQNRRWDNDFLTVQQILNDHMLGRLIDYEAHFDRYKPVIQPTWKERADSGADVLSNLGSHMIDQALVLFGMPEAVTGHLKVNRTGGEIVDWYDIRLHYPHINVNLKSSLLAKEPGPRYLLHGTEGSFLKWGLDPQEEDLKQGKNPSAAGSGCEPEEWWGRLHTERSGVASQRKFQTLPGKYMAFYDNLYGAIVRGTPLAVKAEEALNVIRVIEAVRKSNSEQKTVRC